MTLRIGDLTVDRIVEQVRGLRPALEMIKGLTKEMLDENRAWLTDAGALTADDLIRLTFQSFLVRTPNHLILVDSCIGNDKNLPARPWWHMKTDTTFMDGLHALGVSAEQVDYVMCTHMHVDHVGWNTRLENGRWVPTFPNARYVFSRTEHAYWEAENAKAENPIFQDSVLPIVEAGRAELVDGEHVLDEHIRLLPTPGHTPGHVAVRLGRREEAVVSGDLLHSPLQCRYPEMSVIFDVDPEQAAITRRSFFERYAETDTVCCMTHFPAPSFGKLKREGTGFRCEMLEA
ncbi:MAG: MBL fold metallo-hydrolase [Acetobacteraceae bacterium]|nr:MBL fold metallo-hydrolase [Acetobacteraceae bacterium]